MTGSIRSNELTIEIDFNQDHNKQYRVFSQLSCQGIRCRLDENLACKMKIQVCPNEMYTLNEGFKTLAPHDFNVLTFISLIGELNTTHPGFFRGIRNSSSSTESTTSSMGP